ncbi:MAG: hypothetical protein BHW58_01520 [Azospirillum sp. 51_20]|nr:MAG: hypothetical protein BHW58_01520 [Azospirillum sp. 51_20]
MKKLPPPRRPPNRKSGKGGSENKKHPCFNGMFFHGLNVFSGRQTDIRPGRRACEALGRTNAVRNGQYNPRKQAEG